MELIKPKSVIRSYEDFLDNFLRSYGFYKMPYKTPKYHKP